MTLKQTIRAQRKWTERQMRSIHKIGRWPRTIRKASLLTVWSGFSMKLDQIRGMVEAGVKPAMIREYARSKAVIHF